MANAPLPCPHMGALHSTVRRVKCHWSGSARTNSWSGSLPRKIRTQLSLLSVSLITLTKLAGTVHVQVFVRILRWEARLREHLPVGLEDPFDENRVPVLPDNQTVSTHGDSSWEV